MYKLTASEIQKLFFQKKVSAVEISKYFLNRINYFNKDINAFLNIFEKRILDKADKLDQRYKKGGKIGKLAGVPIALKDNMHIKNEITTCGSKFLSNYKAPFSSSLVKFLEEEDALIIGKTNLDEFAMGSSNEKSAFMKSFNPWDLKCVPGGSSGGSAAATSAHLAPISFGSDTGGSIRQPASFCGIVGLKPTYGRISRYGLVAFGSSLDQIGPFTYDIKDTALILEVIAKHCPHDSTCLKIPNEKYLTNPINSFKGINIGVPFNFLENIKNEDIKNNFFDCINLLKSLGANIIDINLDILKYSIATYYILSTAEASTNLARFDGIKYGVRSKNAHSLEEIYELSREEGFGPEVKQRILLGTYVLSAGHTNEYYKKAQKVRTLIIDAYYKAFNDNKCNLIAMPTSPCDAFELDSIKDPIDMYLQDLFTVGANLSGLPAISIPSGFSKNKKPIGMQFITPHLQENNLLNYSLLFEKERKLKNLIPPLFDKEVT